MECFKLLAIDICCHTNKFMVWKCYCCCLILFTIDVYRPKQLTIWYLFLLKLIIHSFWMLVLVFFVVLVVVIFIHSIIHCYYVDITFFLSFFLICLLQHDVQCNFKGLYRHHHYYVWIWFFSIKKKLFQNLHWMIIHTNIQVIINIITNEPILEWQ